MKEVMPPGEDNMNWKAPRETTDSIYVETHKGDPNVEKIIGTLSKRDEVISRLTQEQRLEIWRQYESGRNFEVNSSEEAEEYIRVIFETELEIRYGLESGNFKPYHNIDHSLFVCEKSLKIFDEIAVVAPWELAEISKAEWEKAHEDQLSLEAVSQNAKLRQRRAYQVALSMGHDLVQDAIYDSTNKIIRDRGPAPFMPFENGAEVASIAAYNNANPETTKPFPERYIRRFTEEHADDDKENPNLPLDPTKYIGNEYKSAVEIHALLKRFVTKEGTKVFEDITEERTGIDVAATYVDILKTDFDTLLPEGLETFIDSILTTEFVRNYLGNYESITIDDDKIKTVKKTLLKGLLASESHLYLLVQTYANGHTPKSGKILALCDLRGAPTMEPTEALKWGDRELLEMYKDVADPVVTKHKLVMENFKSFDDYLAFMKKQVSGHVKVDLNDPREKELDNTLRHIISSILDKYDPAEYEKIYKLIQTWQLGQVGYYLSQKRQTESSINTVENDDVKEVLRRSFTIDRGTGSNFDQGAVASIEKWAAIHKSLINLGTNISGAVSSDEQFYKIMLEVELNELMKSLVNGPKEAQFPKYERSRSVPTAESISSIV